MNRVIKFRAWDKKENEFLTEDFFDILPDGTVRTWYGEQDDMGGELWEGRNDVELMQFTGLLDKNGKEIYEGDVLLLKEDAGMCVGGEIEMTAPVGWDYRQLAMIEDQREQWEIIGNIYENSDLLV